MDLFVYYSSFLSIHSCTLFLLNCDVCVYLCACPYFNSHSSICIFNRVIRENCIHILIESLSFSVQETDSGLYFCTASNSYLRRALTSKKIFLDVLGKELFGFLESNP